MYQVIRVLFFFCLIGFCAKGYGGWNLIYPINNPTFLETEPVDFQASGVGSPGAYFFCEARTIQGFPNEFNISEPRDGHYSNSYYPQTPVTKFALVDPFDQTFGNNYLHLLGENQARWYEFVMSGGAPFAALQDTEVITIEYDPNSPW